MPSVVASVNSQEASHRPRLGDPVADIISTPGRVMHGPPAPSMAGGMRCTNNKIKNSLGGFSHQGGNGRLRTGYSPTPGASIPPPPQALNGTQMGKLPNLGRAYMASTVKLTASSISDWW